MNKYIAWEFEGIIIMAPIDLVAKYYGCITETDARGEIAVKDDVQLAIQALSLMIDDNFGSGAITSKIDFDEGSQGIIEIDMPEIEL